MKMTALVVCTACAEVHPATMCRNGVCVKCRGPVISMLNYLARLRAQWERCPCVVVAHADGGTASILASGCN